MAKSGRDIHADAGPARLDGSAFVVNLVWDVAADLDLAALCVDESSRSACLVYYGMTGTRCEWPFTHLAVDHHGGGRSKLRREHLVISDCSAHDAIYLFVWDHDAIRTRSNGEMNSSRPWELSILDRHNARISVRSAFESSRNLALVGMLKQGEFNNNLRTGSVEGHEALLNTLIRLTGQRLEIAA